MNDRACRMRVQRIRQGEIEIFISVFVKGCFSTMRKNTTGSR